MIKRLCLFGASLVALAGLTAPAFAAAHFGTGPVALTPSITPQVSAYFTPAQSQTNATFNLGLEVNGGLSTGGAFYLPNPTNNSWLLYVEGTMDEVPVSGLEGSDQIEGLLSGRIAPNYGCVNTSCSGNSDRGISVVSPGSAFRTPYAIRAQAYRNASGTNIWWEGVGVTGATVTAGSGYNNGFYAWTSTEGNCNPEPSGVLGVGTVVGGQIDAFQVTSPGFNCTAAPVINLATNLSPATIGTGSGTGAVTLGIGSTTGITTKAGQHFCGVIGQFGADAVNGTSGYQFAAFDDQTGTPLAGSPAVATTVNNAASGTNFFYTSSVLQSQATIGDFINAIGSNYLASTTSYGWGWGGEVGPVGMIWGELPNASSIPDATTLSQLCTKTGWQGNASIAGNTLTIHSTTGGALKIGQTLAGAYVTGSPTIIAGSGSSWTLSGSAQTISSEAMTTSVDPMKFFAAQSGMSVRSFYRLNTTSWVDSSTGNGGSPWAAAVAANSNGPPILTGLSNAPGPALTVNNLGPYFVYPITNFGTGCSGSCPNAVGKITLNGTYSAAALGGTPLGVQAQVSSTPGGAAISGFSWAYLTSPSISGGNWSGSITLPAGGPYYVSLRASNGHNYVITTSPIQVGTVYGWQGQSQMSVLWPSDGFQLIGSATITSVDLQPPGYEGNLSFNGVPYGSVGVQPLTSETINATNYAVLSDGMMGFVNAMTTLSGVPTSILQMSRSGMAVDLWANGYSAQSQAMTGSTVGGPYTATLAFAEASLGVPGAYYAGVGATADTVLAGSVKFVIGGVTAATDTAPAFGINSTSTCVGANGYTVSACSINYLTGVASITFSACPSACPSSGASITAEWTNIVDLAQLASTAGAQTTQYDGNDWVGNGSPATGLISAMMAHAPVSLNAMLTEQCSADITFFQSQSGYAGAAAGMTALWSYVDGTKYPAIFPHYSPTTPVVSLTFPRYFELGMSPVVEVNGCTQWTKDFGTPGSPYAYSGAGPVYGNGTYIDDSFLGTSIGSGGNAHPGPGPWGGQRIGRRAAAETWAQITGQPALAAEPTIATSAPASGVCSAGHASQWGAGGICLDYSTTYNAGCSGTPGTSSNCLDIIVNLNATNATALETCGLNLNSANTQPPAGTCAPTGIGAHVEGFRIGSSQLTSANGDIFEDGVDPNTQAYVTPAAGQTTGLGFSCSIVDANIIQCVKATGQWTGASTYVEYGGEYAFGRQGMLTPIGSNATDNSNGLSYTVTTGGSAACSTASGVVSVKQTNASYGSTGADPYIQFVISGNHIISAYPQAVGSMLTTLGAVVYPPGCTDTITVPTASIGTTAADSNLMGQLVYDNAGASAPLSSVFQGSATAAGAACPAGAGGYCEPGLPLSQAGLMTLLAVGY